MSKRVIAREAAGAARSSPTHLMTSRVRSATLAASVLRKMASLAGAACSRRRMVAGIVFAVVTLAACILVGQRLTHSSWPLAHARTLLVATAAVCYFTSFIPRSRGWHRLFPREQQPD